MKQNFEIRPAVKKDVPLILEFIKQLAESGNLLQELTTTVKVLEETLFGKHPRAEVVLPCINQEPVGYAMFSYHFSTLHGRPTLYLVDLFIIPEARRQGIGKYLLSYLAKIAKEQNCCRFEWTVLDWNESAISFYKELGAKELKDWRIYRVTGQALDRLAEEA